MRGRLFLGAIGAAAVTACAVALPAGSRTSCTESLNQTADGLQTRFCGPAHAEFTLARKHFVARGGTCEFDQKKHTFSLSVGVGLDPWPGKNYKGLYFAASVGSYRGPGVYPILGDRASIEILVTPYRWMTWGNRKDGLRLGAPASWTVGKVKITAGAKGGTFVAPVESPPGGARDSRTAFRAWLSVPARGSFSCS